MLALHYAATFRRDASGRILVRFPDLPGAATDGADSREALEEAIDCLGSYISVSMSRRETIPPASAPKARQRLIPVPLWIAPKFALYQELRAQGVTNRELARRLGVTEAVVRRMLNPNHASKPGKIEMALAALNRRVELSIADAA
ncbi:MAG: type II toxin-antitoxin system HicB family antitoxin [Deltaproteobacteria bacterium]|nr:type II toxin-antitoxin system HicB family antitoxin [Deltaproteobacteria bacterium]